MMKLILTFLLAAFFCIGQLFSQGLYVKINAGYGVPSSTQNLEEYNNYTSNYTGGDYVEDITERVNFSLGQGINLGGNIGFMFNANFGVDLGLSYLVGGKIKSTDFSNYESYFEEVRDNKLTTSATMLRVAPSFILVADMIKINPYARFGAVIGKGKITQSNSNYYYYRDPDNIYEATEELTLELSDGISFGLSASIGALYNIAGNISIYGEFSMISMSYAPEKGKAVKYLLNGNDSLDELPRYEKEILFLDKLDESSETSQNEPGRRLKQNLPFGSFGLNVGVRIGF